MKNKLKRILGVITAISLLLQMSFVITSNAAEYFSLDFESATDTICLLYTSPSPRDRG